MVSEHKMFLEGVSASAKTDPFMFLSKCFARLNTLSVRAASPQERSLIVGMAQTRLNLILSVTAFSLNPPKKIKLLIAVEGH